MIGRYGLPSLDDLAWIRDVVGSRRVLFIGDMDPVDLMVFIWLRTLLPSRRTVYLGVNDKFLESLGIPLRRLCQIPFSPAERKSVALLQHVFPTLAKTLGPSCSRTFERKRKVEFEAVLSALDRPEAILDYALQLR